LGSRRRDARQARGNSPADGAGREGRILASYSATYSDYDVGLRIVLHELAGAAAVRTPPLAQLEPSGAAVQS
jgi:hypothetical protein